MNTSASEKMQRRAAQVPSEAALEWICLSHGLPSLLCSQSWIGAAVFSPVTKQLEINVSEDLL